MLERIARHPSHLDNPFRLVDALDGHARGAPHVQEDDLDVLDVVPCLDVAGPIDEVLLRALPLLRISSARGVGQLLYGFHSDLRPVAALEGGSVFGDEELAEAPFAVLRLGDFDGPDALAVLYGLLEAGYQAASAEEGLLVAEGFPDDGRRFASGVLFSEGQGLRELIESAAYFDRERALDPFGFRFAHCGLRLCGAGERAVRLGGVRLRKSSAPGVASVGRNVERCVCAQACRQKQAGESENAWKMLHLDLRFSICQIS